MATAAQPDRSEQHRGPDPARRRRSERGRGAPGRFGARPLRRQPGPTSRRRVSANWHGDAIIAALRDDRQLPHHHRHARHWRRSGPADVGRHGCLRGDGWPRRVRRELRCARLYDARRGHGAGHAFASDRAVPDIMATGNVGHKPNDALFHAEANALLRAAEPYGGSLAGRTIEMRVDRPLCPSCDAALPYLGTQIGNPTVRIIDGAGDIWIMRDGMWVRGGRR